MKVLVNGFNYKGRKFVIGERHSDGILVAIEDKFIDKDGKLTQTLYGFSLLVDRNKNTIPDIINRIYEKVDFEEFMEQQNPQTEEEKLRLTGEFFIKRYNLA